MIFNKPGATIKKYKFSFKSKEIESVKQYTYRISSNKRPGAYKIFSKIAWALIEGRRLLEGGAYLKFPKMS